MLLGRATLFPCAEIFSERQGHLRAHRANVRGRDWSIPRHEYDASGHRDDLC